MPKFLIVATYGPEGARGLQKEGGSGRRAAVQKLLESIGGRVESFYFAYGEKDTYVVCDVPDATSALAVSLAVNASGNNDRIVILPGLYTEPQSREAPTNDPSCAQYKIKNDRGETGAVSYA